MLQYSDQQLDASTYEEISAYHSILGSQIKIFDNGVAFGSIVILHPPRSYEFGLHDVFKRCESLLASGRPPRSSGSHEFLHDVTAQHNIMFDWSFLEHVTTAIKATFQEKLEPSISASEFLSVQQPLSIVVGPAAEEATYASESVSLRDVASILRQDFGLRSAHALNIMLNHLQHLSFFDRMDGVLVPFRQPELVKDIPLVFPLPLGLDLSVNVETLVSSIEASLSDVDLSINEFGFLMLTKRFWPNRLVSEYALKRLSGRILSWILAEVSMVCCGRQ